MPVSVVSPTAIFDRDPRSSAQERHGESGPSPAAAAPRRRRPNLGSLFKRRSGAAPAATTRLDPLALLARLPLVVYALRADDVCVFVTPQLDGWLGAQPGELVGRRRPWADRVHEDDRRRVEAEWSEWRAGRGELPFCSRYRLRAHAGDTMWVREVAHVVRARAGRPASLEGYLVDESEHQLLRATLEEAQRFEPVARLARAVAHDFDGVLARVGGHGRRLAATATDEDVRADAAGILEASERGAELVRRLLVLPRSDVAEPLDLTQLVRDAEPTLRRLSGPHVGLAVTLPAGPVWIRAAQAQVEQVLVNLVVNARDSMPSGGQIELDVTRVEEEADRPGGPRALMTVADTGPGMDLATKARVFDPFAGECDAAASRRIELATVHAIVTRAGGSITVVSAPGEGSRFVVSLAETEGPSEAEGEAEQDAGRADRARAADAAPRTVLVVEDEPALQQLQRILLEEAGYIVLAASNSLDALSLAAESDVIDAIVCDVVLPDLSGPELAASVGALGFDAAVVFVSGYDRELLASRGMLPRHAQVIQKPFTQETLLAAVGAAIAARSAR